MYLHSSHPHAPSPLPLPYPPLRLLPRYSLASFLATSVRTSITHTSPAPLPHALPSSRVAHWSALSLPSLRFPSLSSPRRRRPSFKVYQIGPPCVARVASSLRTFFLLFQLPRLARSDAPRRGYLLRRRQTATLCEYSATLSPQCAHAHRPRALLQDLLSGASLQ